MTFHGVSHPVRRLQAGFTLVEIIVVLAVVLVLTGIAVPMIGGYMEDGRRARAGAEIKVLHAALASFNKDVGAYPTRDASGASNRISLLITGAALPTTNPWTANHQFATWAMNAATADLMDNQMLLNKPGAQTAAAYATTGSNRWRGPYLAGASPLDPWGRPYVINVISAYSTNATNYKRLFVLSAGPDGKFDTNYRATAVVDIAGDDIGSIVQQRQ